MKKTGLFSTLLVTMLLVSCSKVNINDEKSVAADMQGTWTGYDKVGEMYMHVKLFIKEDHFDGWLQTSDSQQEPEWTVMPQEQGMYNLSAVLDYNGNECRRVKFEVTGRCCGDKSTTIQTLSRNITYNEGQGLYFGENGALIKN